MDLVHLFPPVILLPLHALGARGDNAGRGARPCPFTWCRRTPRCVWRRSLQTGALAGTRERPSGSTSCPPGGSLCLAFRFKASSKRTGAGCSPCSSMPWLVILHGRRIALPQQCALSLRPATGAAKIGTGCVLDNHSPSSTRPTWTISCMAGSARRCGDFVPRRRHQSCVSSERRECLRDHAWHGAAPSLFRGCRMHAQRRRPWRSAVGAGVVTHLTDALRRSRLPSRLA